MSLLLYHRRGVSILLPWGTPTYILPLLFYSTATTSPAPPAPPLSQTHPFPLGQTFPACRCPGALYSSWDLDCNRCLAQVKEWISVRGGMWTCLPVLCLQPSPAVCEKRTNRTFNLPCLCTRPATAGAARELSDALVALQRSQDSKGRVTDCILALGSCVGQTAV